MVVDKVSIETIAEEPTELVEENNLGFRFTLNPSLGVTYFGTSNADEENQNLQWLVKIQSTLNYEGSDYQFASNLFLDYGQIHRQKETPEKCSDNFTLTITPSMTIFRTPSIRLFLETTAQTQIGNGLIDTRKTSFMDPIVLYQTLFVGQKQFLIKNTATNNFEVTYGIGYAFQQTLTNDFNINTIADNSNSSFESGLSAIFQIDINTEFTDDFKFKMYFKAVALPKDNNFNDIKNSRATMFIVTGFYYTFIGIEYNLNMIYDNNISVKRQLEQSLMLSFSVDI